MRSSALLPLPFAALALLAACSNVSPEAGAPGVPHPADTARPSSSKASAAVPAASTPTAPSPPSAAAVTSDAGADAAVSPEEPALHVKVATIGMHVGGGPYDEITKEPMKRSVEPHFAELARCWKHVAKQQPTDVGVDLVIEAAGGHARVSNPRTFAVGEGFVPCVVAFFEGVDFQRPKNGKTVVSYSVRFTP